MKALAALLALLPVTVLAEPYVHLPVSEHYADVSYETEDNWGMGYKFETTGGWDPVVGGYYNSNRDLSVYVGALMDRGWWGYGSVAITGYKRIVTPAPVAFIDAGRVRLMLLPGVVNLTLGF